ncbi:MAG: 4Fe-4S ferredoxin [Promethearchaeota archaeon CR_4]|nr:MAG: 4Fe-4S ferredoxin [Candidatus Lokiarchaeota archaeon CR_4]
MSNPPKVYWASPNEVFALQNTAKNMVTNNLVKTRLILDKILDNIKSGDKVAVKVHVGEAHNLHYLRPDYVREVVTAIKAKGGNPTLIETTGLGNSIETIGICEDYTICVGHRKTAPDHDKIAHLHGYSESVVGAPLKIIDGEKGYDGKLVPINGIQLKDISVAAGLFEFDKMVVISHFKGHPQAGFGGALKQLGIGCVSKRSKHRAHFSDSYVVNVFTCHTSKCTQQCVKACPVNAIQIRGEHAVIDESLCAGCNACVRKCPVDKAIQVPNFAEPHPFVERFIDNAAGVLKFGPDKIRYITFAFDVTLLCDCIPNAGVPVIPDLGIFGSADPVAIDKACVDAETKAPGLPRMTKNGEWTQPIPAGIEKFQAMLKIVNPSWQFEAATRDNLGTVNYDLIKID